MWHLNFVILAVLGGFASSESVVQSVDPRQFGPCGLLVSDRADGQYCASVVAPHNIRVAWQSGYGDSPDLAAQALDARGRKAFRSAGWVMERAGIQTRPVVLSRGVVYTESLDGRDWRVMYNESGTPDHAATVLSGGAGSIGELEAADADSGRVIVAWIRSNDAGRTLELCVVNRDSTHTITICDGDWAFQDAQLAVSGSLATLAWSDFRDAMHPSVYGQMVNLDSLQALWPTRGMNMAPNTSWAWNPEIAPTLDPGYIALAYDEWDGVQFTTLCYQIVDYQMNFRFWPPLTPAGPSRVIGTHDMARFGCESVIAWDEDPWLRTAFVSFAGDINIVTQNINARVDDLCVCASDAYAWVVWNDDRRGREKECVVAQKFDATYRARWPETGLRVCEYDAAQRAPLPSLIVDDPLALVVAWEDYRDHPMIPRIALQLLK